MKVKNEYQWKGQIIFFSYDGIALLIDTPVVCGLYYFYERSNLIPSFFFFTSIQ